MPSVLFVCLGNICRSPAAEEILRQMAQKKPQLNGLLIESCGLGDWFAGKLPDSRMQEAINKRGLHLTKRARKFVPEFFDRFDYILTADQAVLNALIVSAKDPSHKAKIHLITKFSKSYPNIDVPDPYFGGDDSFENVLDILEDSCENLLEHLIHKQIEGHNDD